METLLAFLSTVAGKAVAGTAIAAASVGGLQAADVVELPLIGGDTETVVETAPVDGAEVSNEASDGKAGTDTETETEEEVELGEGRQDTDHRQDDEAGQDGESQGIGDEVSDMAQNGEVDGHNVVALTPAAERVPENAGAPEEPGSQAPEQSQAPDDAGTQADGAGDQADAEPGSQAGDARPESAGPAAADTNRP